MTTKRRDLDERARAYIIDRLEHGLTMSQLIRSRVNLDDGRISTVVPTSVEEPALYDFRSGGKFPPAGRPRTPAGSGAIAVPVRWAEAETVATIRAFLNRSARAALLLENALTSKGDPVVSRFRSTIGFVGDEVVHVLRHDDARDEARVLAALKEARTSPEYVGAGYILAGRREIQPRATIPQDLLDALVARLEILIVGAYDGESFLLWKRGR